MKVDNRLIKVMSQRFFDDFYFFVNKHMYPYKII